MSQTAAVSSSDAVAVGPDHAPAMKRNLQLLPAHQALAGTLAWLPILVLFTRGSFGIDGALVLGSIFYFAAVVTEVPSGWASDRFGRVTTLRIAALVWVVAHLFFTISNGSFTLVAIGEILLAIGFSAISGTDVSLHYDTLERLGIEDEYEQRQSKLTSYSFFAVAASALAGGLIGWIDLRFVFAFSLVAAIVQFVIASRFAEPPRSDGSEGAADFGSQLSVCMNYLRSPFLRWVFGFWIAMVVLEHLAFTLAQPYLTEALGFSEEAIGSTPLWAGVLFASFSFIGALAARNAANARARFGFAPLLLGLGVLSAGIVTVMMATVAIWVAAIIGFRSVLGAVAPIVMTSEIAPLVAQEHRATYLSVHSLGGRLVYGSLMFIVAKAVGNDLAATIAVFAIASWVLLGIVAAAWAVMRPTVPSAA